MRKEPAPDVRVLQGLVHDRLFFGGAGRREGGGLRSGGLGCPRQPLKGPLRWDLGEGRRCGRAVERERENRARRDRLRHDRETDRLGRSDAERRGGLNRLIPCGDQRRRVWDFRGHEVKQFFAVFSVHRLVV